VAIHRAAAPEKKYGKQLEAMDRKQAAQHFGQGAKSVEKMKSGDCK
jgi:hypothetical protein